jgi:dethiobiotin synthetase
MTTPAPAARGVYVTGTDTEVGKTRVAAGLVHALVAAGLRSAGYKPVAAGIARAAGETVNEDVLALHAASSPGLTLAEVGPVQLDTPVAPHLAAAAEGRRIDRAVLVAGARALLARHDALVVEGAGGWCVPLGDDWDSSDVARELGLPVIVVVGLRLGCLNHALLSAESIRARGLALAGWVGNTLDPAMPQLQGNLATLRHEFTRRHGAPCLGVVPHLQPPLPAAVAPHLNLPAIAAALGLAPAVRAGRG